MLALLLLSAPITLYLSEAGNDANMGTARSPIRTFPRLQERLKELSASTTLGAITVRLSGTLHPESTVALGPEASGVRFVGPATISGGVELRNWKPETFLGRKVWATKVPSGLSFRELFVVGSNQRLPRTRLPKTGFYDLAGFTNDADKNAAWNVGQDAMHYQGSDLRAGWRNLSDVEVVAHHFWVTSRLPIASIDEATQTVRFGKRSVFKLANDHTSGAAAYAVENVAEALDTPGQWYLDQPTSTLYYLPRPSDRIDRFVAVAPGLPTLIQISGARRTRFEGVTFSHAEWTLPADTAGDVQAAFRVPGAVQIADCEGVLLDRCTVEGVGTYGIEITGKSTGCRIERSTLRDLGAGGVKIGDGTSGTIVADCVIEHGGRLFASAIGVWAGLSGGNQIVHNRVRDFYYTGISVGWDWGFRDTAAKDNLIAFNEILDIGQNQLSDMGGIYVLGKQPGSRILNNRIDNVQARGYGGWGIYLDEGSTGWVVEDNVVTNTKTGGFHIHYGGNNVIRNNIFAFAKTEGQLIRQRDDQQGPIRFEHNLVVANPGDAPVVVSNWLKRDVVLTGMLYATPKSDLPFGDDGTGRFVSVKLGRDGLPPSGSEVYSLGCRRIDLSKVGPRKSGQTR